jgi:lipoprotein-anchoring transpeptidase ErfK/SrfK
VSSPAGRRRSALAIVAALGTAAAVGAEAGGPAAAATSAPAPPSRVGGATVAKVVVRSRIRARPGAGRVVWIAPTETGWGHGPDWLLVLRSAVGPNGREWLEVDLPIRPNTRNGWIRADHVLLRRIPWWIEVSTRRRLVTVFRGGGEVRLFRAVVGAPATPTPLGLFAVYDPVPQADRDGFLGPWAIHLTALSNVLDDYGGGPGRIAIHGRGPASLGDPLGTARSHGCIRVDSAAVTWLARTIPRGTPVLVRA